MKKQIVREFDPVSNATRVVYREAEDGGLAEKLNDIVSRNILNWASFVIVITCLVVMVTKLKASVRFRSSNALPNRLSHTTRISELTDISSSDINLHGSVDTLSNTQDHQAHATQKEKNYGKTQPLKENSYPQTTQTKLFEDKSLVSDRVHQWYRPEKLRWCALLFLLLPYSSYVRHRLWHTLWQEGLNPSSMTKTI